VYIYIYTETKSLNYTLQTVLTVEMRMIKFRVYDPVAT